MTAIALNIISVFAAGMVSEETSERPRCALATKESDCSLPSVHETPAAHPISTTAGEGSDGKEAIVGHSNGVVIHDGEPSEQCESKTPSLPSVAARETEPQLQEAHRRLRSLQAFAACLQQGRSATAAMKQVDLVPAKRSRLEKKLRSAGLALPGAEIPAELVPQYIAALRPGISTGPRPKYPLTENESLVLRGLVLARSTQDALHFAIAVEEFANHPACLPATRELILAELDRAARLRRQPVWPVAIRRCGYPTSQEAAAFRGRKHSQEVEQTDRRGCYWIDETNARRPLLPHTIWEMDDASDNEPRQSLDPDTGAPILTRQALWTQDVYSAALLGLTQVARPRDSYRIEDVADHVLRSVEAWGLPAFMRLEMGRIWAGTFFHGFVPDVPRWPEGETWGGLEPLCRVVNVFKSKGKGGIESSFNLVQALAAHRSLSIGRLRGDFEEATTALIRSHSTGEIDARFWSMDLSTDAMAQVAARFNERPKLRRMFGREPVAPIDLLMINSTSRECRQDEASHPYAFHAIDAGNGASANHGPGKLSKGVPLLPSERWRFCPVKRLGTVRGGHVEFHLEHYPQNFRFRINGIDDQLHLDHGYQVLAAFHPGRPEEGCHIFNAELGVRNRDALRRAERLILAPFAEDAPQIDLSGRADFTPRKKAAAAVRRNFRAIGQAMRADYAQSSDGRHLLVEEAEGVRTVSSEPPMAGQQAGKPESQPQAGARSPSPGGEGRGEGGPRTPVRTERSRQELSEQASIARRLLAMTED
jgi:hypothetical protein